MPAPITNDCPPAVPPGKRAAAVTVIALDSGGTANGGVARATHTFGRSVPPLGSVTVAGGRPHSARTLHPATLLASPRARR